MAVDEGTRIKARAALLAGDSPRKVSEEFGISINTTRSWRRRMRIKERPELDRLLKEAVEEDEPTKTLVLPIEPSDPPEPLDTEFPPEAPPVKPDPSDRTPIGELLATYLRANLRSQIAIQEVLSDKEYLMTQNALTLASVHEIANDKAVRMLSMMTPKRPATPEGPGPVEPANVVDPSAA